MARALRFAIYAAMAAVTVSAGTLPEQHLTPSVGVYMDFDSTPGDASVEVMKKEVDDLLKPSGVTLGWRLAKENQGKETFSGLVVLKFRGRCRVEGWTQLASEFGTLGETEALGSTSVVNGRVLPFSEVECDRVRKALAYMNPGAGREERQRALGMALGRVVAHEIYHILARTTEHAAQGLAKASESLRDLVSAPVLGFRDADSQTIGRSFDIQ